MKFGPNAADVTISKRHNVFWVVVHDSHTRQTGVQIEVFLQNEHFAQLQTLSTEFIFCNLAKFSGGLAAFCDSDACEAWID